MSNLRTPLSQVKGLGSAKEGTGHFWTQRLSAIAMVPLLIWFCFSLASLVSMNIADIQAWLSQPFNAIMMILFIVVGFYHAKLGVQVVIEDYVSNHVTRTISLILITFVAVVLAIAGVFSVLRVALAV